MKLRFDVVSLASIQILMLLKSVNPVFASVIGGPIVNPANNHTYYLLDYSPWTDAENEAISLGGHLVTINDEEENAWVAETFGAFDGGRYDLLWIGINDAEIEGTFVWASGELVTYTNWHAGEPNGAFPTEDYGHIHMALDGEWVDRRDSDGNRLYGVVEVTSQIPETGTDSVSVGILYNWLASDTLFWGDLNEHWAAFGNIETQIDYTTLLNSNISYGSLRDTGFDVIIINNALSNDAIYSDDEINAIKQYVTEGHGLIVTGGTLRSNGALDILLGFSDSVRGQVFIQSGITNTFEIIDSTSTLFRNISNYTHSLSNFYAGVDWAGDGGMGFQADWEHIIDNDNASLVAMIWNSAFGEVRGSAISVFDNGTYRAAFCGHTPATQHALVDDKQFVYNMIKYGAYGGSVTKVHSKRDTGPSTVELHQNYPNPFNPLTTIKYQLVEDTHIVLTIYNSIGQEVIKLVDGYKIAGYYSVKWDAGEMASGLYFYRIRAGDFVEVKKMLLLQ